MQRIPVALQYIYIIIIGATFVDIAIISVFESANVAFQYPSTLLRPYHIMFWFFFVPLVVGLVARAKNRSLGWKGMISGLLILASGLEDFLFVLVKYQAALGKWWSWTWNWTLIGTIMNGISSNHLFLWCLILNLIVLWWWKVIKIE